MLFEAPSALGTAINFSLHFGNDSPQRSPIQRVVVTVADTNGTVFEDRNPLIQDRGMGLPLLMPTQPYQRGDAGLFRIHASFRDLDYDKVNLGPLTVRLIDALAHEDHFIHV